MVSSTSILFILSTIASTTLAQQCYWPAGNLATGMVPCSSSGGGATTCCSNAEMCLSNGLCRIGNDPKADQFARGACTDANWGPGCLQHCAKLSHPGSFITNSAAVFLCSNSISDPAGANYCCETAIDQKTGCCSGTTFSLPAGAAAPSKPKPAVFLQASSSSSSKPAPAASTEEASSESTTSSADSSSSSSSTSCTSTYSALPIQSGNATTYSPSTIASTGPSPTTNGTVIGTSSPTAPLVVPTGAASKSSFSAVALLLVAGAMAAL